MTAPETALQFLLSVSGAAAPVIPSPDVQARTGLFYLLLIVLIPVLIALFFLVRFVYRNTIGERMKTTIIEDYRKEAGGYERKGKFVSAAAIYEDKLKEHKKAAALYEKGGDYRRAALLYESLGLSQKAREMYEKQGDAEGAAGVSIQEGEYEEAAKIYNKAGQKLDAAIVLERAGRRMAAVKAYREAGEYRRASVLLEQEGMMKEAAEMFGLSLRGKKIDSTNVTDFYAYAFKLEKAGDAVKAVEALQQIDSAYPTYKDVRERLHRLSAGPADKEEVPEGSTTLRSFIRSGRMEPKYSLKLWVQILKKLQDVYKSGRMPGFISPDNIAIDSRNNISFLSGPVSSAYISPEVSKDLQPDARADIYALGVILYEMLTGDLDGIGTTRVIDVVEDVPDWLDEIVIRCIRKVREDRYQSAEEIFADLRKLSHRQA
jgi:tetratricopeptide (TPR) repeat protein